MTGALIAATAVQIVVTWFIYKKPKKMQLVTFILVAIFGGLTIFLHDENFIKWKVTHYLCHLCYSALLDQSIYGQTIDQKYAR